MLGGQQVEKGAVSNGPELFLSLSKRSLEVRDRVESFLEVGLGPDGVGRFLLVDLDCHTNPEEGGKANESEECFRHPGINVREKGSIRPDIELMM